MAQKNARQMQAKKERIEKKSAELQHSKTKKKTIITVAVSVAVIAVIVIMSIAITAYLDSGNQLRSKTALSSDNYKVNNAMLSYYLYSNVNSELDTYGTYYEYYYDFSLNTSLKDQVYQDNSTWFDYFMSSTANEIGTVLLLCENAKENGIALDESDYAEIETEIDNLKTEADEAGKSLDNYIVDRFGRGIKESDVREAVELYHLAFKNYERITDSFSYTDEELEAYYSEHATDFQYADYIKYDFTSKDDADKLASAKTAEEFTSMLSEYLSSYKKDDGTAYTEAEIQKALWDATKYSSSYDADSDFGKWAFDSARKNGDTTVIELSGKYSAYYMLNTAHRLEATENVRHILFKFDNYDSKDAALAAAEAVYESYKNGDMTEDSFIALADEHNEDSSSYYENVRPGNMVLPFNDWCFDPSRSKGDTDIVESEFGYHIMYYAGEGETAWKADVTETMKSDSYKTWLEDNTDKYPVTLNEKNMYLIPGDVATR